ENLMWCEPPSIPPADIIQPLQSNWTIPLSSSMNDKQQLSFIYQPGVGLYDKKVELDQDLRTSSTTEDVDERIQGQSYRHSLANKLYSLADKFFTKHDHVFVTSLEANDHAVTRLSHTYH
ncbi:unnamed protein product, partial [Rotaria magnacalcarata]